mgnify:CR=1
MSSEEGGLGLAVAERFFGLILVIIGSLGEYYTLTSMNSLGAFAGFFAFLAAIPVVLGVLLITAKTE